MMDVDAMEALRTHGMPMLEMCLDVASLDAKHVQHVLDLLTADTCSWLAKTPAAHLLAHRAAAARLLLRKQLEKAGKRFIAFMVLKPCAWLVAAW